MTILWNHAKNSICLLVFAEAESDSYLIGDFHFVDCSGIDKGHLQCIMLDDYLLRLHDIILAFVFD